MINKTINKMASASKFWDDYEEITKIETGA